jgi:hypothetical protein
MYTLTIQNFPNNTVEYREFQNIREAVNAMYERCDAIGYNVVEAEDGTFYAGGIGCDWRIELDLVNNF